MQEVECLRECIDEFLVLGGIFSQINLSLAVTGVLVILATLLEILIGFIIMLIDNRHL